MCPINTSTGVRSAANPLNTTEGQDTGVIRCRDFAVSSNVDPSTQLVFNIPDTGDPITTTIHVNSTTTDVDLRVGQQINSVFRVGDDSSEIDEVYYGDSTNAVLVGSTSDVAGAGQVVILSRPDTEAYVSLSGTEFGIGVASLAGRGKDPVPIRFYMDDVAVMTIGVDGSVSTSEGASGSFTTSDGKTVTVVGGLITTIVGP